MTRAHGTGAAYGAGTCEPGGLVTLGETMGLVSSLDTGQIEYARRLAFSIGGAESNVAIGVVRLGGTATWIGRLGRDATGDLIERRLRSEAVTTIAIRDDGFTGIMVRHRRFGTSLAIDYHRAGSAASRLRAEDLPHEVIARAGVLHVTGVTPALSESARRATFAAVHLAHEAGVAVSVDVNFRSKLWSADTAGPVLRDLVAGADIVFAGRDEAAIVTGARHDVTSEQLACALATLANADAIIKDGSRGCTALIGGELHVVPAIAVQLIDPVGAGDSFVAGYLSELLLGEPPPRCLATAIAAGAFTVTVPGDCEGLPRRDDLELFVHENEDGGDVRR